MKRILVSAPATCANVGPGYDIFAMAFEQPHDEIEISLKNSNDISIEVKGETSNIPLNVNDNTAGLALLELKKRFALNTGFDIVINKGMVSGCGLGTTGASASAVVFGANKLLNLNLQGNEIIDLARMGEVASGGSPHADNVAAAYLGGFVLVKSYNPIDVLKLELPEIPVVLAIMRKNQRTTRGFITYDIGQEKLKEQMARCSNVIHSIHIKDIKEFGKSITVDHVAEPVRGAAIQGYYNAKQKVLDAGAYGCNISGGGSSVFAICPENETKKIEEIMHDEFRNNPNFVKVITTKTSNLGVREI